MGVEILVGDSREILATLPSESVQCCVTSPPYWGLRDYQCEGQLGLEKSPEEYVATMVGVFREVRRVLRNDGTLWLNLGDTFSGGRNGAPGPQSDVKHPGRTRGWVPPQAAGGTGLAPKQLVGVPWRTAFAMQADGWFLRSDVIWSKPNAMPESVTDRPTGAHEYLFLFSKSPHYFYDYGAIREPASNGDDAAGNGWLQRSLFAESLAQDASATKSRIINGARKRLDKQRGHSRPHTGSNDRWDALTREEQCALGSNKRSVWTVAVAPFAGGHFATFPPDLIKPCILAGCPVGGVVLDPFAGSGTTGMVALELGRNAVLIELNPTYAELIKQRTNVTPGLAL